LKSLINIRRIFKMKSIAKSITAILLTFAVLCAFAACENNKGGDNSDVSSTSAPTASSNSAAESADNSIPEESSKAPDENGSKKLLYKLCRNPGAELEYTTTYEYTEFGEIATETSLQKNDTQAVTTKYEYNEDKKLVSVTTSYGERETGKITYEYNDLGLLVKETNENDMGTKETVYTYDKDNRLISEKVVDGVEKKYTYNEDGSYTVDTVFADGSKRGQEVYNKNGLLVEDKAEEGNKMVCTYNDKGDILSSESYDSMGALTHKETYTYDGQTVVKKSYEYDELIITEKYYYDDENNLIKTATVDEAGKETVVEEREYKLFDIVK